MRLLQNFAKTASLDKIFGYEIFIMKVVIDHREPQTFRTLFGENDDVFTAQMECGDFLINDQWLFERKTVRDLCSSLVDGRLFK